MFREELTAQEMSELAGTGVTQEELMGFWRMFPDQEFVTALGAICNYHAGRGQERNKPFQTEAEATADVSGEAAAPVAAE